MRFGGHETFPVREGWLYNGLALLRDHPDRQADPFVADHLGVGRNMAKSIWHWLKVTRLVDVVREGQASRLVVSDIGRCILKNDPYLLETGTWWALHANIATQTAHALVWGWFFNEFAVDRFDRTLCLEQLVRKLQMVGARMPSRNTLSRDVQCLLQSYARPIPAEADDPEDANESPFRDLGLMVHHRDTGTFSAQRGIKDIPPEIFGYIASLADPTPGEQARNRIAMKDVLGAPRMPGRVLSLSGDALATLLQDAETTLGSSVLTVRAMGGERVVELLPFTPTAWLERLYRRVSSR